MKVEDWGKDHWSLLAYVVLRGIDYQGKLEVSRMRIDGEKYPTRTKAGNIPNHNDYDCLNDMEDVGIIKNNGTITNPHVEITEKGWDYVLALFKHKANGGSFGNFVP